MAKHFALSQVRTPASRARETLSAAERLMASLRGAGSQALELLHLFDQIVEVLAALEASGADVRAERARFEAVQQELRRSQACLLAEAGAAFREERVAPTP